MGFELGSGLTDLLYKHGATDPQKISPDSYSLDLWAMAQPGHKRIAAALLNDYQTNIEAYPQWQAYLRKYQPRTLIVWGRGDPIFLQSGVEAFRRDLKGVDIKYFETSHFALEEDADPIATEMLRFLDRAAASLVSAPPSLLSRQGHQMASSTQSQIRLYRHPLSGHSHRTELMLSLLGLPFEVVDIDLRAGAHKRRRFWRKNPLGQVPVIEDEGVVIADSNAILVYLAGRYDAGAQWLPRDPLAAARVQWWLSLAAGPIAAGPCAAVTEVGPGVEDLAPGDHVVLSFIPSCGKCPSCQAGMRNLCDLGAGLLGGVAVSDGTHRITANGQPVFPMTLLGTFSPYMVVHRSSVVKIDESIPFEVACLVGCGVTTGYGSAVQAQVTFGPATTFCDDRRRWCRHVGSSRARSTQAHATSSSSSPSSGSVMPH